MMALVRYLDALVEIISLLVTSIRQIVAQENVSLRLCSAGSSIEPRIREHITYQLHWIIINRQP